MNNIVVKAWVRLGDVRFIREISVPEDCLDEDGNLLEDDVAEYVERCMTDDLKLRYGAVKLGDEVPL